MKKKLFLGFLSLLFLFYGFKISASIMPDNPNDYYSIKNLNTINSFNIIKGTESYDYIVDSTEWCLLTNDLSDICQTGTIRFDGYINGACGSIELDTFIYIENYNFSKYEIYANNEIIYQLYNIDYEPKITICEEYDLYKEIGITLDNYTYSHDELPYYVNYYEECYVEFTEETILDLMTGKVPFIFAATYLYNSDYDDKDIQFITSTENPISFDDIYSSVTAKDLTDNELEISILSSDYDPLNVEVGSYKLSLRISDKSGNIIIQDCIVNVYDITKPILKTKELSYQYLYKIPIELIANSIEVIEDSEYIIEVVNDDYSNNYNQLGTYDVEFKVEDIYGNYNNCVVKVNVFDDRSPVITIKEDIYISTLDNYSLEDLRQFITITDDYDGIITDYIIEDINGYLNNTKKSGKKTFKISVNDKSGNPAFGYLTISVEDYDYPFVEFSEYAIITTKGYNLTKEEVINLLISTGQINSQEITISTTYEFYDRDSNLYNLEGDYILKIKDKDGIEYNNKITVLNSEEVDYSQIEKKENNNYVMYIIVGISSFLIITAGILFFVIYKKRH